MIFDYANLNTFHMHIIFLLQINIPENIQPGEFYSKQSLSARRKDGAALTWLKISQNLLVNFYFPAH